VIERKNITRNKNDSNENDSNENDSNEKERNEKERTREKVKRVWSCNRSSMNISRVPSSDLWQ
jgi:hypothetical protein